MTLEYLIYCFILLDLFFSSLLYIQMKKGILYNRNTLLYCMFFFALSCILFWVYSNINILKKYEDNKSLYCKNNGFEIEINKKNNWLLKESNYILSTDTFNKDKQTISKWNCNIFKYGK